MLSEAFDVIFILLCFGLWLWVWLFVW